MKSKTSLNRTSDYPDNAMYNPKSFLTEPFSLITDLIIMMMIIAGISLFQDHADVVLFISWFVIAIYTISLRRYKSFLHLIISTCIAIFWVYMARDYYDYNFTYYKVAGMNLLAVLSWALGLVGILEVFNHFVFKKRIIQFLVFALIFWIVLILIETYAFHVIVIRNTATGSNIGLPFCNCIHAPWWMRIVYFTMGPAYYEITKIADRYTDKLIYQKTSVSVFPS
jgi:hypothetical protein